MECGEWFDFHVLADIRYNVAGINKLAAIIADCTLCYTWDNSVFVLTALLLFQPYIQ